MTVTTEPGQPWLLADGSRVRGEALTGDLAAILSLEDEAMPARRAIAALSWHLRQATLVGRPAPIVHEMEERTRTVRPGDLVVESTQGYYAADAERGDWYRGIGVLLLTRREWVSTDDEWAAERAMEGYGDDERIADERIYIQYGPSPDDVCRWENCEFRMVPWYRKAMGSS